ncbi:transcription factor-like protein DPB [Lolium rigidum]|uniref:transcription factor-like protein DPB n=1 Tax=Lolium rigidum TaxID=89674 RepID=UPI001F5CF56B|nr:transcription factor-like protein DPB [Lolium rigidum]
MVSGMSHRPDDDASGVPHQPSGAGTPLATPPPSHSASTSGGSAGSPSRSDHNGPSSTVAGTDPLPAAAAATAYTPASDGTTSLRLNNLDINGDDAPSSQPPVSIIKKKKRRAASIGPDKGGRGLRQFSMKVCEKVESKGRTTYNEVADELVAEFSDPNNNIEAPDPDNPNAQQYDEKNIRRRVYDALNVLMAMEIISKDKKQIQWKGLPRTSVNDIEELQTELVGLKGRIEKKSAYLQELQDQYLGMQNLVLRNEELYGSGTTPSGGVALPFILIQTRPHAMVEVEISEDMQLVHFDFNSTPFELHDDSYVIKALNSSGKEQNHVTPEPRSNGCEGSSMPDIYRNHVQQSAMANNGTTRLPSSPPVPGILKGRVKHEHQF